MPAPVRLLDFPEAALEIETLLGSGAFGEVFMCRVKEWKTGDGEKKKEQLGTVMAVKIVRQQDVKAALEETDRMRRALETAKPTHVPNVWFCSEGQMTSAVCSHCMQGSVSVDCLGICMEYIDGPSLSSIMRHKTVPYRVAMVVLMDLFVALGRLHPHGIVHKDVKPDNILVSRGGDCYLCDFGLTVFLEDFPEGMEMPAAGTPAFMAPELFFPMKPTRYDTKYDMWSAGMVGFELACGFLPWHDQDMQLAQPAMIFQLMKGIESVNLSEIPMDDNAYGGPRGRYGQALDRLLQVWPVDRPSVPELFGAFPEFTHQVSDSGRAVMANFVEESLVKGHFRPGLPAC